MTTLPTDELVEQYRSGSTLMELAARYRVSHMTVKRQLARAGQQCRRTGPSGTPYGLMLVQPNNQFSYVVADPNKCNIPHLVSQCGMSRYAADRYLSVQHGKICNQQGKKLPLFWPDEITGPAWDSTVRHRSGQNRTVRIGARDCTVVTGISTGQADEFYRQHHIQGGCNGSDRIGLQHNGQLVALMTFADPAVCRGRPGHRLLQRYATSCLVPGGCGRLLARYRATCPLPIVSYSDNRYSRGDLYIRLGFSFADRTDRDYRYWRDGRWFAKNRCQRIHLARQLGRPIGDHETEYDLATQLGYLRCSDFGRTTWVLR